MEGEGGFLVLLGINLGIVLLGVIVVELIFGHWFAPYTPPHFAIVGRTIRFEQDLYQPPSVVLYVRDRFALRGVREPLSKVEVVTVGGSTTDQKFITEGETWQDVARDLSGMAIANAGIDGMSSSGHVIAVTDWLQKLPDFRPRYYVHYIGLNDSSVARLGRGADRSGTDTLMSRIRVRSVIDRTQRQLESYIRTWMRGPRTAQHSPYALSEWTSREFVKAQGDPADILAFIERVYRPNLQRLLALHRQNGEKAIFMSQPLNPLLATRRDGDIYVRIAELGPVAIALGMVNSATEAICGEQPDVCHFLDVPKAVKFAPDDFYDEYHTTPVGGRKIGALLANELMRLRGK